MWKNFSEKKLKKSLKRQKSIMALNHHFLPPKKCLRLKNPKKPTHPQIPKICEADFGDFSQKPKVFGGFWPKAKDQPYSLKNLPKADFWPKNRRFLGLFGQKALQPGPLVDPKIDPRASSKKRPKAPFRPGYGDRFWFWPPKPGPIWSQKGPKKAFAVAWSQKGPKPAYSPGFLAQKSPKKTSLQP